MDDRIRPREVDVLEDAGPRRLGAERLDQFDTVLGRDDDFAILDVAHEASADDVERAGLRRQDRAAVEVAEHQGTDAQRVACADHLLVGEADERVGALDLRPARR